MWIGFIRLRIGPVKGTCDYDNELLGFKKGGELLY
jgi:hypothetical protein